MESATSEEKETRQSHQENSKLSRILLGLAPTWLALAWLISKAQWYWQNKPDMQFGWIVLMLSSFIIWDQWKILPVAHWKIRWPFFAFAIPGMALLFLLQIYAAAYGTMPALIAGLSLGVFLVCGANIHYIFGWNGIRFFAFPLLFLLIAMPLPSAVYNPVVGGLQSKVTAVNVEVLNIIGIPAQRVGSLIHLPNGTVGVDEACSGIRSLQSTVMATLFIGYLTLKRRALQVALLASGIFLAIVGNLVRSLYLSINANTKGLQAVENLHDSAGWSILIFTAAGVALLAWAFSKLEKWAARESALLSVAQKIS